MSKSILDEAKETVKDRAARYDNRENNFGRIAKLWSVVFGHEVEDTDVALCLILLKVAREIYKPTRDNLVDIAGYADCLADLNGYYDDALETCDPVQQAKDYIAKHPEIIGPAQPGRHWDRWTPPWETSYGTVYRAGP